MESLKLWLCVCLVATGLIGCEQPSDQNPASPPKFELLSPEKTGVFFENRLEDTETFNILSYLYYYNGGGVAIGDVNNDGLPDIYFTANLLPNKLYLNKGDFQFEDITEQAGVAGLNGWSTGVSMVDINGDGWLDIYVNYVGDYLDKQGKNQLFINNGLANPEARNSSTSQDSTVRRLPTFTEQAEAYGLDLKGYSTQATFFDYDGDGDLDMYQLNHSIDPAGTVGDTIQRRKRDPMAGDRLMRNDGIPPYQGSSEIVFTDVSEEAGIIGSSLGYGLSVLVVDMDKNGCPDLYVCNDFHEDDYFYLNQCNGTFKLQTTRTFGHTSRFSMGSDWGDINNDGLPDLITLDMKPAREDILKTSDPPVSYNLYRFRQSYGYHHQYPHNALQLNQGEGKFSEIAYLTGIDATDWSWSALFCDLDNDGLQDLFITNGIYHRPNDMDYIKFIHNPEIARKLSGNPGKEELAFIEKMPSVAIPNYVFHNEGGLTFSDQSHAWGLDQEGFSQGAAYADLDLDGDLDLVVNNINEPAHILRNNMDSLTGNYIRIALKGKSPNTSGIGTKVWVWANGILGFQEMFPVRGFQSSVEAVLHFGLGEKSTADSIKVLWPEGQQQLLTHVPANQKLILDQSEAGNPSKEYGKKVHRLFQDESGRISLDFTHNENEWDDFQLETLIPHLLSTQGPAMAVADVNGDGRDDIFLGGAFRQPSRLFVQQADGDFIAVSEEVFDKDATMEDLAACFVDIDGDGDVDLYVGSGGNQFGKDNIFNQDRIYINKGNGVFERGTAKLPALRSNTSCVIAADIDGDMDQDLFVGSRSVSGKYGLDAPMYILQNDGSGKFSDITPEGDSFQGMVTDAIWDDLDADGDPDLIVVGEWMPVTVFENTRGVLSTKNLSGLAESAGWWNTIESYDFDGDGDRDFVLGNLGLNSTMKARPDEPCSLYVKDFDKNGATDPIICYYKDGVSYPMATRDELLQQIVSLRKKYPNYTDYATETVTDIFGKEALSDALKKTVFTFESAYLENKGKDGFSLKPLPREAQLFPVYGIETADIDEDGNMDLLLGGNFFGVGPNRGRYDAGFGLWLKGNGKGQFQPVPARESGLWLMGEVRHIQLYKTSANDWKIIIARNNDRPQIYSW